MTEQSGRFLIFLINFIASNIRIFKSSFAIASSMVSVVMSFIFETTIVKFAYARKYQRNIYTEKYNREMFRKLIKLAKISNCQF